LVSSESWDEASLNSPKVQRIGSRDCVLCLCFSGSWIIWRYSRQSSFRRLQCSAPGSWWRTQPMDIGARSSIYTFKPSRVGLESQNRAAKESLLCTAKSGKFGTGRKLYGS
jgi:hypothetical protein